MPKKFIQFALIGNTYNRRYRILGVTTRKGRQTYGRWLDDDSSSHVSDRDVVHYFDSEAEATASIRRIEAAEEHHRPLIAAARTALTTAETNRRIAIKAAAVKKDHA